MNLDIRLVVRPLAVFCVVLWASGCDETVVEVDSGGGTDAGDTPRDAAGSPDTGTARDSGSDPDTGGVPGSVPMFIAQGDIGRTVVSCDDGRTWVGDRGFELEADPLLCGEAQTVRCYDSTAGCRILNGSGSCETQSECDCDHNPGAPQGIVFSGERFVATFGWGPPGTVRNSLDGSLWNATLDGETFGGIAVGMGRVVLGDRQPRFSTDHGVTWSDSGMADLNDGGTTIWNVRQLGFVDVAGGLFLIYGSSGANDDLMLSTDGTASWQRPTSRPDTCTSRSGFGNVGDVVVMVSGTASCYSTDNGDTWTEVTLGSDARSRMVSDGTEAFVWARGTMIHTTDAMTWTETSTVPDNLDIGAVARSADGTFVAVRGGWQNWYDEQRFYRSTDGITWETLDAASAPRGHRIRHIAFGRGAPGGACP